METLQSEVPNVGLAILCVIMFFIIVYMAVAKLRDRKFKEELSQAIPEEAELFVLQMPEKELETFPELIEKLNGRALKGMTVTIEAKPGIRITNWYFESLVEAVNSTMLIHTASHKRTLLSHRVLGREGCYINSGTLFNF